MEGMLLLNLVVQILSYVFIALLIFVSYLKFRKGTKAESITIKSLCITTLSAFLTSAFLILMAGWVWDWLGFISVFLGLGIGVILALVSKMQLNLANDVLVQGRRIGTVIWLVSVIIGEFILMLFSNSTALQASFLFGFFLVLSMNLVYFFRYLKIKIS